MYTRLRETYSKASSPYVFSTVYPYILPPEVSATNFEGAEGKNQLILDEGPFGKKPKLLSTHSVDMRKSSGSCSPSSWKHPWAQYWNYGIYITGEMKFVGNAAAYGEGLTAINLAQTESQPLGAAAVRKAYAAAAKPAVDFGVGLAEAGQTLRLIASPLKAISSKLGKILHDARKLAKRKQKTFRKKRVWVDGKPPRKPLLKNDIEDLMSQAWLTLRYGLLPLMSDVDGLRNLHTAQIAAMEGMQVATGVAVGSQSTVTYETERQLQYWRMVMERSVTTKVFAVCKLYYKREFYFVPLGLSPWNIPSLIWELTPWSFCVDWVLDVGTWLRSLEPTPHLSLLDSCLSYKTEVSTSVTVKEVTVPTMNYTAEITDAGLYVNDLKMLHRTSAPPWERGLPSLNIGGFGLIQAIDTLSLIGQKMPKLF